MVLQNSLAGENQKDFEYLKELIESENLKTTIHKISL